MGDHLTFNPGYRWSSATQTERESYLHGLRDREEMRESAYWVIADPMIAEAYKKGYVCEPI